MVAAELDAAMTMERDSLPAHDSMTRRTLRRLQERLGEALALSSATIETTTPLHAVVPVEKRRQVWKEMAEADCRLPSLQVSGAVFWTMTLFVLIPLSLAALIVKSGAVFLSLPELALLFRKLSRRFAVHPRKHLTLYEAAVELTPFNLEDYQAGLWPAEEVANKVRLIIADSTGTAFESIRPETRIADL